MSATSQIDSLASSAPALEPLVRPLPSSLTPEVCFRRLSKQRGCVWLDSCRQQAPEIRREDRAVSDGHLASGSSEQSQLARYSYLSADPFSVIRLDKPDPSAIARMADMATKFHQPKLEGLPPMQGGWMGWFGYELGRCFEKVPAARFNEFQLPMASVGLYDVVLSWDHQTGEGWLISQGWPSSGTRRMDHAYRRLKQFQRWLDLPDDSPRHHRVAEWVLSESRLAPQFQTRHASWKSNFSSQDYRAAVGRCVEYIHAGDIFQVNLAQRLLTRARCPAAELFLHLREVSPAPFAGFADLGRVKVLSSSPERFVQVTDGAIETRPIKGTRPRMSDPRADRAIAEMLQSSAKDRSENVMIVDLLRNDLSRISLVDSVKVDRLCGLEKYPFVWHLVSVIRSRLDPNYTAADLIQATFPGGSITGAPKIRAMEIIAELEPTTRGPYCGSLGYLSFAGDLDLNILIRTITDCDGWWQVPVGGGIVADSDPKLEEQETWHKAEGMVRAIDSLQGTD